MRTRTHTGTRLPLAADGSIDSPWVIRLADRIPPLDLEEVFACPVSSIEVEIGTGKGMFLRREAAERPDTGFIGVERAFKFHAICATRLARDGRPNIRTVCVDAYDLLARWIPVGSLGAVHVYFPDPWPKKRHAKRRLLSPALFDLCARATAPGGLLAIATDVGPYFADAIAALEGHASFARIGATAADLERITTNYAVKYAREGRSLHLARYQRNASAPPPIPPPPSRKPRGPVPDPPSAPGGAADER